jgi:hypothetical protein
MTTNKVDRSPLPEGGGGASASSCAYKTRKRVIYGFFAIACVSLSLVSAIQWQTILSNLLASTLSLNSGENDLINRYLLIDPQDLAEEGEQHGAVSNTMKKGEEKILPKEQSLAVGESSASALFRDQLSNNEITLSTKITPERPLFVLSLPHSGTLVMDRYFKCAGLGSEVLGRLWTKKNLNQTRYMRVQIGKCIMKNFHAVSKAKQKNILYGCGNFRVWTVMDYVQKYPPKLDHQDRTCFFPSLYPGVLDRLLTQYPRSTIINVLQDPNEWARQLPPKTKAKWQKWCNPEHDNLFPRAANATHAEWARFYRQHQRHLRETVAQYSSVTLMEVDLKEYATPSTETAQSLEESLGIPPKCWLESAVNPNLPTDIRLPIFVTSLPKSATSTTHNYLNCGLGSFEGAHQWTKYEVLNITTINNDTTQNRTKKNKKNKKISAHVQIGMCMRENMQANRPVLDNCGDHTHWSDIGMLRPDGTCFYPTIHDNGLKAMYQYHPYGTILHVVRDASTWYQSAQKWYGILERWSRSCDQFPQPNATTQEDWIQFYEWHTHRVRQFAHEHPTMTYIEVNIEDTHQTQQVLADNFGFTPSCWGQKNINTETHDNIWGGGAKTKRND